MTRSCLITPRAREGLLRIALQVEETHGEDLAERVLDQLGAAFELLTTNPKLGHRREDLSSDPLIRFWNVGPTLIAYRERDEWVEMLFVERAELDWEEMLREDLQIRRFLTPLPHRFELTWRPVTGFTMHPLATIELDGMGDHDIELDLR